MLGGCVKCRLRGLSLDRDVKARLLLRELGELTFLVLFCWAGSSLTAEAVNCSYPQFCGAVEVPYPFSADKSCALTPEFHLDCRKNSTIGEGSFPFLQITRSGSFQVLSISNDSLIVNFTEQKAVVDCNNLNSTNITYRVVSFNPYPSPFAISSDNYFTVFRCNYGYFFTDYNVTTTNWTVLRPKVEFGMCITECSKYAASNPVCQGEICCVSPLPDGARTITYTISSEVSKVNCGGFAIPFYPYEPTDWRSTYSLKLLWSLPYSESSDYRRIKNDPTYACSDNSNLTYNWGVPGYVCTCLSGYEGDGYYNGTGCEDIDECKESSLNHCVPGRGVCHNTPGGYNCSCRYGSGDGYTYGTGCVAQMQAQLIAGPLGGFGALVIIAVLSVYTLRRRYLLTKKQENFIRNGGFQLQQIISSTRGRETAKLFSMDELKIATKNFATYQRLGAGGYGTVFKGTLEDGRTVAIKKANRMNENDTHQFLNEVAVLSQINHRNIVRLLGCCLETDVPLLVYEYVSNGTLAEHLRGPSHKFLDWSKRLSIAIQTAEALAYLHASASPPILHRDVKPLNILLDSCLDVKLADFGASRLIPTDQHELDVSTGVQGTVGYLDPEYFQSFRLTDKSDVYSFGVVLAELITSLKAVDDDRDPSLVNLAQLFIYRMHESGGLEGIIDHRLTDEAGENSIMAIEWVGQLAGRCLTIRGEDRPTMEEVVEKLHWIQRSSTSNTECQTEDEECRPLITANSTPDTYNSPMRTREAAGNASQSNDIKSFRDNNSACSFSVESIFQSGR